MSSHQTESTAHWTDQHAPELEQQVSLALALALQLADAEDEHCDQARQRLVEFVEQLTLQQAQALVAIVYLGQQAAADFEAALAMVIASPQTHQAIASRLARCGPLAKYLLAGLEKWRAERAAAIAENLNIPPSAVPKP